MEGRTLTRNSVEVRPLGPVIGAEIHGLDLAERIDSSTGDLIHRTLLDHLVVFLPDQRIGPAEHLALARHFGDIEPPHPVFGNVAGLPEVTVIEQHGDGSLYNDVWHTDVTFRECPAKASILHCQVTPPEGGGDTLWSSLHAAYEALSPVVRDMIEELTAVHDYYMSFGSSVLAGEGGIRKLAQDIIELPPVEHPVVRTHPETGRKGLFVNRTFTKEIKGLGGIESDHILRMLCEFAEHPNYQVRRSWKPGDLAIWDNRCTMHLASSSFTGHRKMHRVTVIGDRPFH